MGVWVSVRILDKSQRQLFSLGLVREGRPGDLLCLASWLSSRPLEYYHGRKLYLFWLVMVPLPRHLALQGVVYLAVHLDV